MTSSALSWAPAMYRGCRGPGTFEMVTLKGGFTTSAMRVWAISREAWESINRAWLGIRHDDRLGIEGCARISQAELARWIESHPGRRVVRYSCRHPGVKETRVSPPPLRTGKAART